MVAWIWEVAVENGEEEVEVWVYLESGGDDRLNLGWWEKDESRKIPRSEPLENEDEMKDTVKGHSEAKYLIFLFNFLISFFSNFFLFFFPNFFLPSSLPPSFPHLPACLPIEVGHLSTQWKMQIMCHLVFSGRHSGPCMLVIAGSPKGEARLSPYKSVTSILCPGIPECKRLSSPGWRSIPLLTGQRDAC